MSRYDYLRERNRVLKERLKGRRFRLTDEQRRRLAAKGKIIGRRLLATVATIVTPDTILRWRSRLIAAKDPGWAEGTRPQGRFQHDLQDTDFFTTEVWTPRGLMTSYALFVIDIATTSSDSLHRAITEFVVHYHEERHHQGIGNKLIRGLLKH